MYNAVILEANRSATSAVYYRSQQNHGSHFSLSHFLTTLAQNWCARCDKKKSLDMTTCYECKLNYI